MTQTAALLPDAFPRLTSGDYVLREILASDAADWHAYMSDPRVYEYISTPIMSLADVEGLIGMLADGFGKKRQIRWALVEPETGRMIGDLGFNAFHTRDRRAEVGYGLSPEHWRRGLMTCSLASIIDYGFENLALNKIEATVNVNNERSSGLLRKLGFELEGTLRDYRNRRGVFGDALSFGLLKREWASRRSTLPRRLIR
jgi:ribosomal-protein-alanine N-acetyltransferase